MRKFYFSVLFTIFLYFPFLINSSHSIQDQLLTSYFEGKPLKIEALNGGLSGSKNYKIHVDKKDYVLRMFNPNQNLEVRKQEIQAATYAGNLNIGPKIYSVSADNESMLMDFIVGKTLSKNELQSSDKLRQLLQTIKRLHESKGNYPQGQTIFQKIRLRIDDLKKSDIPYPEHEVDVALQKLSILEEKFKNLPQVPCHNDLNALNILVGQNGFTLIDWTDASLGFAFYDLGYFSVVNNIGDERFMLTLYLDRPPSDEEIDLLRYAKQVSLLSLFTSIFLDHQGPVLDKKIQEKRRDEIKQKLRILTPQSFAYYSELHSKGELKTKEEIISLSLAALKAFLTN